MFERFRPFSKNKRITSDPADRYQSVESFLLYYGHLDPTHLVTLSKYDLVILESEHLTRKYVMDLQQEQTLVFGYVSIMETPLWHSRRLSLLSKSDILIQNQRPVFLKQWNAYLMDLRQPSYQQVLLKEIDQHIQEKQINGILFDTVGDIDDYVLDQMAVQELREAYIKLLLALHTRHPSLLRIQNRGVGVLEEAAPFLDGFLWEDWKAPTRKDDWARQKINLLRKLRKNGFRVFTVTNDFNPIHETTARKLGFVHLNHRGDYHIIESTTT